MAHLVHFFNVFPLGRVQKDSGGKRQTYYQSQVIQVDRR